MGEDCSAKKLSDLKTGEKPIYVIIFGFLCVIAGLVAGYYLLKQHKEREMQELFVDIISHEENEYSDQ
jgi:hypothetical protein